MNTIIDFFSEHISNSPVIHYISPQEVNNYVSNINKAVSLNGELDNINYNKLVDGEDIKAKLFKKYNI